MAYPLEMQILLDTQLLMVIYLIVDTELLQCEPLYKNFLMFAFALNQLDRDKWDSDDWSANWSLSPYQGISWKKEWLSWFM